MIKFFRKIRKRLVAEKKIRNYLMYAVGEIILVVIGILIALAINNGNQSRINRQKEQIYLSGLRDEFETSKRKLTELMKVNKTNYNGAKEIIEYASDTTVSLTEKQFSELLYNTFANDIAFNPNNSLLNEMINSGSLKDISNSKLRVHLTNWISYLEDISKQENDLRIQREKILDMFRNGEISIRTVLDLTAVSQELGLPKARSIISNLELLHSTKFENNVLLFVLASYATETTHYQPLMENLDTIVNLIKSEIDD